VFTHLPEDLQQAWIQELARALKPGGFLLITVHGDSHLHQLSQEEQREFQSGQLVVIHEDLGGTNFCGAYHPEQYVRHHLARGFEVVDFVPVGARDADQDIYLLRKPGLTG
jgi:SAM-dependent methyltransferase